MHKADISICFILFYFNLFWGQGKVSDDWTENKSIKISEISTLRYIEKEKEKEKCKERERERKCKASNAIMDPSQSYAATQGIILSMLRRMRRMKDWQPIWSTHVCHMIVHMSSDSTIEISKKKEEL